MKKAIKTNYSLLVYVLFVIFFLNACKKADNEENQPVVQPTTYTSSMSAKIDGVTFVPQTITVQTIMGKICISGMTGQKNLQVRLVESFTTGSHSMSHLGDYTGLYNPDNSDSYLSQSGTINITEYVPTSGKIKGTFSFVGSNYSTTVNVTNGVFEAYK